MQHPLERVGRVPIEDGDTRAPEVGQSDATGEGHVAVCSVLAATPRTASENTVVRRVTP
ncbi:hypothetical protein [Haladaptatus sp. W1]|uniref:hypothetical protein n=1 Tax=Haladaptatus sp. W1 TaxID=1897478 RepID=UPI001586D27A|nr:hypothetical protein [Haladaptatus sp. W1]